MKPKTINILYWVITGIFALFMIMDAIGGITYAEAGIEALTMLRYPIYIMPFMGVLKILGALTLLLPGLKTLKEWAYAGFAFNCILAAYSWASIQAGAGPVMIPLVVLAVLMLSYYLFKKRTALQTTL